jgi:hypothetical protein
MATLLSGTRPAGANIVAGPGLLLGFLVSHAQATAQTLTFYDNTLAAGAILLVVHLAPEQSPAHVRLGRENAVKFSVGLSYDAPNCELAVWALEL